MLDFLTNLNTSNLKYEVLKKENNGNIYYNGNFPKALAKIKGDALVNAAFDDCEYIVKQGKKDDCLNEAFFAWLSVQVGIETCKSNITLNGGDCTYISEHFCPGQNLISLDTFFNNPRRHMFSYGLGEILAHFNDVSIKENIFERAYFSWVIHNYDLHTKNISFILDKNGGFELAPSYDLLCLAPHYDGAESFAMSVNHKNERIDPEDFLVVAKELEMDVEKAERAICNIVGKVEMYIGHILNLGLNESYSQSILNSVLQRLNQTKRYFYNNDQNEKSFFAREKYVNILIEDLDASDNYRDNSISFEISKRKTSATEEVDDLLKVSKLSSELKL